MALQKDVEQPTGVVASYHRIIVGLLDFNTGQTTLDVATYLDAAARLAGNQPVARWSFKFNAMPDFNGDPRPWAYTILKTRPEFSDAKYV